jgi:3-oxoacyl-[acyl-carrier-protein] synthase-3
VPHSGKRSRIAGLGINLPSRVLTNAHLEKMVDTTDEWILTRTGIRERRIADDGVTASALAIPAAQEALRRAGVSPEDLDLIICATSTPDMLFPSTACLIQRGIGAGGCPAFDILAACSGFVYGLSVVDKFVRSGSVKTALLVASEIFSRTVDWEDRNTCVLFGDGSAAAVIKATEGASHVIDTRIHADGTYADLLTSAAGPGASKPAGPKPHCIKMKGNQTFKVAVTNMAEVCSSLLTDNGYTASDVALVIPHQANIRIIHAVAKSLDMPEDKMYINVHRYGNTSAATIPIAMYEAQEEGRLKKGDLVLLAAFGGGLTWGSALIRW